jgi:hypothetical protein
MVAKGQLTPAFAREPVEHAEMRKSEVMWSLWEVREIDWKWRPHLHDNRDHLASLW